MPVGTLKVPLSKRQYFVVTGGPFRECPDTMIGVKMAKEIAKRPGKNDVDIPTDDFKTPERKLLYRGLTKAVDQILAGESVYVGCMGGKGRTGLFLAVLAKAFGVKSPVKYVRANYYAHAVETADQEAFVRKFTITPPIRRRIKRARRWAWLKFWKTNLTKMPGPSVVVLGSEADQANLRASQRAEARLKP